jgi:hypothetical protein
MSNATYKILLVLIILLFPLCGHSQAVNQKQFIENEAYIVHAYVESDKLIITVKNKTTLQTTEYKKTAVFVNNVQNVLFLSQNSFLVEGTFGIGTALFLATIMDDGSIRPNAEIRVGSYFISPNKATLIFSNWNPISSSGSTYLYAVDLNSDYRSIQNSLMVLHWIKGKMIFETKDNQRVAKQKLILSDYLIWVDGGQRIYFLCEELISNSYNYLFEYNFKTGKSKLVAKLNKHNSRSTIETFKWNDKEKTIEIIYTGIKTKKRYKYIISAGGKLKYRELPAQTEKNESFNQQASQSEYWITQSSWVMTERIDCHNA